jgi:hypothetical protein
MKAFLVKHHRDSQTAVLSKESLNGIRQFSHLSGVPAASGIAGPSYLAEAKVLPETILCFLKIEIPLIVNEGFAFLFPDAEHLSRLFFQGHARKQVPRAAFRGKSRVHISRFFLGPGFGFHGSLLEKRGRLRFLALTSRRPPGEIGRRPHLDSLIFC